MDKYKELYDYSEAIAKRYYRFYAKEFLANAMDIDDLMQESKITVWQTIEKYKNKSIPELKKLISQAVGWKLNYFRLISPSVSYKFINLHELLEDVDKYYGDLGEINNEESNYNMNEDEEISICQIDNTMDIPVEPSGEQETTMILEELKEICSPKLYDMLYKIHIEGRTCDSVGKIYGLTRQGINVFIKREVKKLRKYLK